MARTSNKDKALAYAANKGIILTMEDADAGDELGAGAIEVWSIDAHLSESGWGILFAAILGLADVNAGDAGAEDREV